jgi:hypothetical protein
VVPDDTGPPRRLIEVVAGLLLERAVERLAARDVVGQDSIPKEEVTHEQL